MWVCIYTTISLINFLHSWTTQWVVLWIGFTMRRIPVSATMDQGRSGSTSTGEGPRKTLVHTCTCTYACTHLHIHVLCRDRGTEGGGYLAFSGNWPTLWWVTKEYYWCFFPSIRAYLLGLWSSFQAEKDAHESTKNKTSKLRLVRIRTLQMFKTSEKIFWLSMWLRLDRRGTQRPCVNRLVYWQYRILLIFQSTEDIPPSPGVDPGPSIKGVLR